MQRTDKARRKLLKSLTLGSATAFAAKSLPETWTRPVLESAMLPAHAQTTSVPSPGSCEITGPLLIANTGVTSSGPYSWTVTNTGSIPLTGVGPPSGIIISGPSTTGPITLTGNNVSIPDPLNPGATGTISVTQVITASCPPGGGSRTITVQATFLESTCQLPVSVTCSPPS